MKTEKTKITPLVGIITDDDFSKLHTFSFTGNKNSAADRVTSFKCIDKIFWKDEETGEKRERIIRYVDGEQSVFADEQYLTNSLESSHKIDKKIHRLQVQGNAYNINGNKRNLLAFMRLTNHNGNNPNRDKSAEIVFFEFKPEQNAQQNLAKDENSIKARYIAHQQLTIEEIKAVLVAISNNPAGYEKILTGTMAAELRSDAVAHATSNPTKFLEILESPSMKYKYVLCKAVAMKIIKVSDGGTHMTWHDGGLLFECNIGKNVLDEVASRYVGGEERATQVFKEVKLRLDAFFPQGVVEKNEELKLSSEPIAPHKTETETPKSIYDRLKSYGQLKHAGIAIHVGDAEWSNIGHFQKDLKDNKEKYDAMKLLADQAELAYKSTLV